MAKKIPEKSRPFRSKYSGSPCLTCKKTIQVGHMIQLENMPSGQKLVYHWDCEHPTGMNHLQAYVNVPGGTKPNTYRRKIKRK